MLTKSSPLEAVLSGSPFPVVQILASHGLEYSLYFAGDTGVSSPCKRPNDEAYSCYSDWHFLWASGSIVVCFASNRRGRTLHRAGYGYREHGHRIHGDGSRQRRKEAGPLVSNPVQFRESSARRNPKKLRRLLKNVLFDSTAQQKLCSTGLPTTGPEVKTLNGKALMTIWSETRRSGVRIPPGAPFFSQVLNHLGYTFN